MATMILLITSLPALAPFPMTSQPDTKHPSQSLHGLTPLHYIDLSGRR
jgi:hypothetical protein